MKRTTLSRERLAPCCWVKHIAVVWEKNTCPRPAACSQNPREADTQRIKNTHAQKTDRARRQREKSQLSQWLAVGVIRHW